MKDNPPRGFVVFWWTLTLAWAGLIFYLSSQTFGADFSKIVLADGLRLVHLDVSPGTFAFLHVLLRKLAHLTEYAIFALLLYGTPGKGKQMLWRPQRALACILLAAAYSLTDEFHQLYVPGRHASLLDCGVDTMGASIAMLVPYTHTNLTNTWHP
jgi:VanZ family protein